MCAIKVLYARSCEREAMKDAVEMAVLSTVRHPNVVQVYSCMTEMVELADGGSLNSSSGGGGGGGSGPPAAMRPRFRRLFPGEDPEGTVCNIVVMVRFHCIGGVVAVAVAAPSGWREGLVVVVVLFKV